jgi:hypothetical protein
MINAVLPVLGYSSNWVNVNNWCQNMPGVVNPQCGRLPEPILFQALLYTFGFVPFVVMLNAGMRAAGRHRPSISRAKLFWVAFVGGGLCDFLLEIPLVRLRLWAYPGTPRSISLLGSIYRYPVAEPLLAGLFFGTVAYVRFFKDDLGLTVIDRGVEQASPLRKGLVSVLALVAVLNCLAWTAAVADSALGFYSSPYPRLPAHLVNGMCDAPGLSPTSYGPCPGSPGFRMPVRKLSS